MAIIHAISFIGIVIWYARLTTSARHLAKQELTRNEIPDPGENSPPQYTLFLANYSDTGEGGLFQTPNCEDVGDKQYSIDTVYTRADTQLQPILASVGTITNPTFGGFAMSSNPNVYYFSNLVYTSGSPTDDVGSQIWKVENGITTLIAGGALINSTSSSADGTGALASFGAIPSMVLYGDALYVCDYNYNKIRKVSLATGSFGVVTTVAGNGTDTGPDHITQPYGITTYDGLQFYVISNEVFPDGSPPNAVPTFSPAIVVTFTLPSVTPPPVTQIPFSTFATRNPVSIVVDSAKTLYIYDLGETQPYSLDGLGYGDRIFKAIYDSATSTYTSTILAGAGFNVMTPVHQDGDDSRFFGFLSKSMSSGMVWDGGETLFVADTGNRLIRAVNINTGFTSTVAGVVAPPILDNSVSASDNNDARLAVLAGPQKLAMSSGSVYFVDQAVNTYVNTFNYTYRALRRMSPIIGTCIPTLPLYRSVQNYTQTPVNGILQTFTSQAVDLPSTIITSGSWNLYLTFLLNTGGKASVWPMLYSLDEHADNPILLYDGTSTPVVVPSTQWYNEIRISMPFDAGRLDIDHRLRLDIHYSIGAPSTDLVLYSSPTVPAYLQTTIGYSSVDSNAPGKCNMNVDYASPKHMTTVNLIVLVLVFFAITILAHIWYATSPKYLVEIQKGWNPYRWLEYGLSASVMTAIVGITSGIRDISQLQELVLLTAAMQGCGWIVEKSIRQQDFSTVNVATGIGWLLFVALWFSILWNFFFLLTDVNRKYKDIDDADGNPIQVPGFVFFIVFFQLLQYASFGAVQLYHINKAKIGIDYASKIEPLYVNLSAIAKVGLASGIGYGFLFRANGC